MAEQGLVEHTPRRDARVANHSDRDLAGLYPVRVARGCLEPPVVPVNPVVATSYLLGVSTRRVEKLVEQLGVTSLSKSQVSDMAQHLDAQVEAFRNRPLDAGPYTFVWVDALNTKVREYGRTVNVHALIAVGVNGDGQREVLGLDVSSQEDGAGWLTFLRSLTARRLSGVRLVISDAHRGPVDAIGARRRRPATSSGFASRSPARRTRRRATDQVSAVKIRLATIGGAGWPGGRAAWRAGRRGPRD